MYAEAVSDRDEKIEFCEAWARLLGWGRVTLQQVLTGPLAESDPFGIDLGRGDRSAETRLGWKLIKMRDQVWGGYQVVKDGRGWRLQRAG
jgi:hypothetical protein